MKNKCISRIHHAPMSVPTCMVIQHKSAVPITKLFSISATEKWNECTSVAMLSLFMCCEIFKALIVLSCRFFCAHLGAFIVVFLGAVLLFKHCLVFRRTVWFFFVLAAYLGTVAAWCTILFPVLWFRGRKFENVLTISKIAKPLALILGIEYEIRNKQNVVTEKGVVVSNHPSILDSLSMMYIADEMQSPGTLIASSNISWLGPVTWVLRRCGFGFIDTRTPGLRSTYEEMNRIADEACNEKVKIWIYPEGRTSERPTTFKKGAFRIAVDRQIPILPVVFSPHYFIDWDNFQAETGKIIIDLLPPISTTEYTHENMNSLIEKTHAIVRQKYEELRAEIEREKSATSE